MAIALIWLLGALVNPSAALVLFTVAGDQRWRQIDFGVKPQTTKRSRREVLAAWLQSVRADGV